jgi:peroxiredoxin
MIFANSLRVVFFVSVATLLSAQEASDATRLLEATASKYQNLDSYEFSAMATRPLGGGFIGKVHWQGGYASPKMTPPDIQVPILDGGSIGSLGAFDSQGKPAPEGQYGFAQPVPHSLAEMARQVTSARIIGAETVQSHLCKVIAVQYEGKNKNPNRIPVKYWIDPATKTVWKTEFSEVDIFSKTGALADWTIVWDSWVENQPPSASLIKYGQWPAKERTALIGHSAPEITGKSLSGDPFRLSELKSKVVVLDFWGTYCGPCNAEMASLERLKASLSGKPVEIWSVTEDSTDAARRWLAERGRTLPSAIVAKNSAFPAYGVETVPQLVIIDRNGVVAHQWAGLKKESDLSPAIAALLPD